MYIREAESGVEFPYGLNRLSKDNPKTSFPKWEEVPVDVKNERLSDWGVYPVEVRPTPVFNKATQEVRQKPPEKIGAQWVVEHEVIDRDIETIRAELKAQLKAEYQKHKDGGITVDGVDVPTTDKALTELVAASVSTSNAPRKTVTPQGDRITLTPADIASRLAAVDSHIQSCKDRHYDLIEEIDSADTPAKLAAIELDKGW